MGRETCITDICEGKRYPENKHHYDSSEHVYVDSDC